MSTALSDQNIKAAYDNAKASSLSTWDKPRSTTFPSIQELGRLVAETSAKQPSLLSSSTQVSRRTNDNDAANLDSPNLNSTNSPTTPGGRSY